MRVQRAAVAAVVAGAALCGALGLGACGGDQPDLDAFCERLATAVGPQGALAGDYAADPNDAGAVIDELESIQQVAPLEIEPSLAVIIDTSRRIIEVFADAEGASLDADQLAEAEAAAAELARYSDRNCGLTLN